MGSRLGSWIGSSLSCHAAMRFAERSTTTTSISGFLAAIMEQVGPPYSF
jgi:hypothetical protein